MMVAKAKFQEAGAAFTCKRRESGGLTVQRSRREPLAAGEATMYKTIMVWYIIILLEETTQYDVHEPSGRFYLKVGSSFMVI
ncbi:hypothetical protein MTR_8g057775 [Medicago truncatula]|uniref:Uncharacterized protein n=1 Tax=Medicago truncatula TaxID=3880 RepID=A0A072U0V8_MEDTR|nr:hypothetical protein MTR_8g057775 [Medicago truncatula]